MFTPPVVSKWPGPLATLMLPNATGGANWQGGALDPETNMFYIFTNTSITPLGLVPADASRTDFGFASGTARDPNAPAPAAGGGAARDRPARAAAARAGSASDAGDDDGRWRARRRGRRDDHRGGRAGCGCRSSGWRGGGRGGGEGGGNLTVQGLPLVKPPYGRITALDLNKGELVWQIAHGDTPDNIKNHPALKGVEIPRTGRPGRIGVLITKTLAIAGEGGFVTTPNGRGAMLRAYDKATGKDIGAIYMPAPQTGSPMTYLHNGKQYLVVAISGANYSGELVAFRLPG